MKRILAAVAMAAALLTGFAVQAKENRPADPGALPGQPLYVIDRAFEWIWELLPSFSRKSESAYFEKLMREREAEALRFADKEGRLFEAGPLSDEALDLLGERLRHKHDAKIAAERILDSAERATALDGIDERAWQFDKDYLARIAGLKAKAEARKEELLGKIDEARKAGDRATVETLKDEYATAAADDAAVEKRERHLFSAIDRQGEMFENHQTGAEKAKMVFKRVEREELEKKAATADAWKKLLEALEKGRAMLAEGETEGLDRLTRGLQTAVVDARLHDQRLRAAEEAKRDPTAEPKKPEAPKPAAPKPAAPKPAVPARPAAPRTPLKEVPSETVNAKELLLNYFPNLNGQVGVRIDVQYGGTDGLPPYHFGLETAGGFPPPGVVLDVNGQLSGTPRAAGAYTFSACVVDTSGQSVCAPTVMVVAPEQQAAPVQEPVEVPPPPPPPVVVARQISLNSRSCTFGRPDDWGEVKYYWVDVSGTASGPEGTRMHANLSSGSGASDCGSWSRINNSLCERGAGQPEQTQWSFRFSDTSSNSTGKVDLDYAENVTFSRNCP